MQNDNTNTIEVIMRGLVTLCHNQYNNAEAV